MDKTGTDQMGGPMECVTPGTVEERLAKLENQAITASMEPLVPEGSEESKAIKACRDLLAP